ncbi:hypothetical protein [Paludisphaera sp.]|uniref:hypothetical protein n=1 Tax=Paludisphaera sp. TaxID=2017432 RepID=UPI00301CCF27
MTTRHIDPDFEQRRSKAPGRGLLGAGLVLVGLSAGMGWGERPEGPPGLRWEPYRWDFRPARPMPAPGFRRMIVPAPRGIDEGMIHQARPDIDPGMIVPAFPTVDAVPMPVPMPAPIPPAPGLRGPGGTTPRR